MFRRIANLFPIQHYVVQGESMNPSLKSGQHLLAWRKVFVRNFSVGDVVVLRHPIETDREIIKRIKSISKDKMYYVEGDNASQSQDSRAFGYVAKKNIIAKVI